MAKGKIQTYLDLIPQTTINKLCSPLKLLGIKYFLYYLNFDDGRELKFTTKPEWTTYFVENDFHKLSVFTERPSHYPVGFYLVDPIENEKILKASEEKFTIGNNIVWINPQENVCEFAHFGSTPDNKAIVNFYLNNLDLLQSFIVYFKNETSKLIKKPALRQLLVPNRFDRVDPKRRMSPNIEKENIDSFKQKILIKKFYLDGQYQGAHLSRRELDCLRYLLLGKTSKEIARTLKISYRTVESHLENVKQKLAVNNKAALLAKLEQIGLTTYL